MVKADTYIGLIHVDVQKFWVERKLVKLAFPTVGAEASWYSIFQTTGI